MGWFSALFSKGSDKQSQASITPTEYQGYLIYPESTAENGQYRVSGRICKPLDDKMLTHTFIRSDLLGSQEDANSLMVTKAKMMIDQNGDRLFD
ncbi:HlyU family transcriptional regulator [Salinivibrio kushneri]|uniref:HlyU family transcriptional regulator n=1 Tax=Salinivibrio kushneri TaxID=1908198 RepID=A0AA47KP25_9GAMM|nr:HlyU family transcriptional regulator [Salinivibrio kushneri]WBA10197.1 HlyU family transcriptional regulator [Salinivibrio kushneri]